ncbi:MAG: CARDB domain-containing protein [Verrucomicrobiota bacterium]
MFPVQSDLLGPGGKARIVLNLVFTCLVLAQSAEAIPDFRIQPGSGAVTATNLRRHLDFSSQVTLENIGGSGGDAGIRFQYEFVSLLPSATRYPAETRQVPSSGPFNVGGRPIINTPGGTSALPLVVQVDLKPNATMPLGDYRIELTIDPDMVETESNTSNNVFVLAPNVTLLPTADLSSTILTLVSPPSPIEYDAGENLVVRTTFKNVGDIVDIGPSTADFFLVDIRPDSFLRSSVLLNLDSTHFLGARVTPAIPASAQSQGAEYTFDSTFTFPAGLDLLNYNLAVLLNPNGTVPEPPDTADPFPGGNYTVSVEQLRVEYVHERPDFEGVDTNIPVVPDLAPGEFHTFTGRVSNVSFLPSIGTTTIHHYFSPFAAPGNSILIGTSTLPPLGPILSPTQHHDFSINLQIPAGVPSGDYTYFFIADDIEVIPERNEENNIGRITGGVFTVTSLGLPDIRSSGGVTFSPSSGEANDSLSLSVSLENSGELPTGPFDVRFYLVTPGSPSGETGTVLAVQRSTTGIAAGQTSVINATTSVPSLPPGDYEIRCAFDINDEVTEIEEFNTPAMAITDFTLDPTTPAGMPDLIPTNITPAVTDAEFDESVSVTVQITNIGNAATPANVYRVALSPDPFAGGANDIVLGVGVCPAIGAGSRADIVTSFSMPPESSMPPVGTYYWVVTADSGAGVTESDETNNELVFNSPTMRLETTRVVDRPIVNFESAGVSPERVAPGERIAPTARVENTGTFAAGQLKVSLYLSDNLNFTPVNDVLLHAFDPVDLPGGGAFMDYSALVPIPEVTASGDYFVLWVIDPFSEVPRDDNDPIVSARNHIVRERSLKIELFDRTPTHHRVALFDTDPNEEYIIEFSTDMSFSGSTASQPGIAEFPVMFDVPIGPSPSSQRYFRGATK